jgi:hypothetical protein
LGGENALGDAEWNPLQGAASLGDAAPTTETEDPAAPSGSGGGSSDGGGGSSEDLSGAIEELEGKLFINLAADAMYVVTAPLSEMTYVPGGSGWGLEYDSVSCDAASDILISGGCSGMSYTQRTQPSSGSPTESDWASMGAGSFPEVQGGVPVGWTCGRPLVAEGTYSVQGYSAVYTYTVNEPAEMYAVCMAVD